jgi:sugar O-acyltransferase (sialic acid O-acetyltransferase NeuD family)
MKKKLLIYGAGKLGKQVHHLLTAHFAETFELAGFVDDCPDKKGTMGSGGLPVLGSLDEVADQSAFTPKQADMVIAVGYGDMQRRRRAYEKAKSSGYQLVSLVHPKAHLEPTVQLGEGTIVLAGVLLDQHVRIGPAVYLDIGVSVGEESVIACNNYVSAGTTIAGYVQIGENNFIGLDCTLVNEVVIGNGNYLNAKSLIHRNVTDSLQVIELHEQRNLPRRTSCPN